MDAAQPTLARVVAACVRGAGADQARARLGTYRGAWECLPDGLPEDAAVVAVVAGRFRPPHRGHCDLVARLARCCAGVIVAVAPDRGGVMGGGRGLPAALSVAVWEACLPACLPEALRPRVAVLVGEARPVCDGLATALRATGRPHQVVVVGGQEALCVRPGCPFPAVLLPREAHASSTAMATVPAWATPGDEAHISHIADFLPPALAPETARGLAVAIARKLAHG